MKATLIENVEKPRLETEKISLDEFLTTKELMQLLKIKQRKTLYNLVKEGMPSILVGRNYRYLKSEVIDYLKKCSERSK